MLKLLSKRSTLGRSLVLAACLAMLLSFVGNLQKNFTAIPEAEQTTERSIKIVLDTVPAAIKVFRTKIRSNPGSEGWLLTIAETLGALVAFAAILALLWAVLKEQIEKLRISFLRRHTVVLGFDKNARLFLKSKQRPRDRSVVVLDPIASGKIREKAHAADCFHYAGAKEAELRNQLTACRVKRSERIIISAGTDTENLELVKEISDSDATYPPEVVVTIEDGKLHQQLEENDPFMQCFGTDTVVRLFNYAKTSAVDFLSRVNFSELATQQAQQSVSLLVFGTTAAAAETITHYLRMSPSLLTHKPQITWIVQSETDLKRMLSLNYPPLANLLDAKGDGAPLTWALTLRVYELGEDTAPYSEPALVDLLQAIAPPTAIIVAEDAKVFAKTNIQIGTALRQASRRLDALLVPIFVFSPQKSAEDRFLACSEYPADLAPVSQKKLSKTTSLADILEPFGRSDEVCSWGEVDTAREAFAQHLHKEYLKSRANQADAETMRAASLQPWATLSETYKNANRRAADHLKMLTFSKSQFAQDSKMTVDQIIEILAAFEHDAWRIDRELDGWKHASNRDNGRKLHPDLIPYADLSYEIQEYDRAKVREILTS